MNENAKNSLSKILYIVLLVYIIGISLIIVLFNRIDLLLEDPLITPELWLDEQPWVIMEVFNSSFPPLKICFDTTAVPLEDVPL